MARHKRGILSTNQTIKALREIGEHVVDAAKKALEEGAEQIVEDAKERCPTLTGALRNSIRAIPKKGGAEYKIVADAKNSQGVEYAQYVEYSPHINRPFLKPAFHNNVKQVNENIEKAIKEAIKQGKQ